MSTKPNASAAARTVPMLDGPMVGEQENRNAPDLRSKPRILRRPGHIGSGALSVCDHYTNIGTPTKALCGASTDGSDRSRSTKAVCEACRIIASRAGAVEA